METLKLADLAGLPYVVDVETAARALGLSRTLAYELAKRDEFPCRIIRVRTAYRIPTAELLRLLGMNDQVRAVHSTVHPPPQDSP